MKVNKSGLKLHSFEILEFNYKFIDLPESKRKEIIDFKSIMEGYPINVDFMFKEAGELFLLFMLLEINTLKSPSPGYVMKVQSVSLYDKKSLDSFKEHKFEMMDVSIGISISSLRGFLNQTTSLFPFGGYLLPVVDLLGLIKEKKRLMNLKWESDKGSAGKKKSPILRKNKSK